MEVNSEKGGEVKAGNIFNMIFDVHYDNRLLIISLHHHVKKDAIDPFFIVS